MTMSDGQQIRERMWDYVYGLLSEEESQEMVARIKSDPQLARLYAEVRLKGELVAQAALVEDSSLQLKAGTDNQPIARRAERRIVRGSSSRISYRSATWFAAAAASALIAVLAAGLLWPRPSATLLARNFVVADVVAPASLPAGLTNSLVVHTYHVNLAGEAAENASAKVEVRLIDSYGKEQFQKSLQTDISGQANIEIPGAAIEPGTRLEVNSTSPASKGQSLALTTELPIEPEPEIAYYLPAEPPTQASAEPPPGVPVSTWNFAAFSAKPIPETQLQIVALGDESQLRDGQQLRGGANVNGIEQQLNRAAGRMLAGQVPAKPLAKQEPAASPPQVVEAGQPVQVDIPPQLADKSFDVVILCRGVTVAATSENEPAAKENSGDEAKFDDRKAKLSQRRVTIPLPPEADGLMEVEIYDQTSDQPIQRNLIYRQPLRKLVVELPSFQNRVVPGDDVELKLHVTDEKGQPAANTRVGIRVWNEPLVQQLGDRPLLLTDAVRSGQAIEYGQNAVVATNQAAQKQATQNQINPQTDLGRLTQQATRYRRAMRTAPDIPRLNESAAGGQPAAAFAQNRPLSESLEAPRAATMPTTKIELASNRDAVKLAIQSAADEAAAGRQRAIRILGCAAVFGGIAVLIIVAALAALKIAASVRVLVIPLTVAVASLLIGVAWLGGLSDRSGTQLAITEPAASATPPATDLAAARSDSAPLAELRREAQSQPAGGPAAAGGSMPAAAPTAPASSPPPSVYAFSPAGAGNVASPAKPSEPESLRLAAPAAASAGAPGGLASEAAGALSARSRAASETAKASAREKKDADKELSSTATPPSLFFDPNLTTDANGNATIRFKMPSVACEYRLLIDALGNGRIGSHQELLICGSAGK